MARTGISRSKSRAAEEFAKVQAAVLRECIANLARLKDTITQNIGGTLEPSGLDNWPAQIGGVRAALRMLGHARAEKIVNGIERHLLRIMQPGGAGVSHEFLDRLADAVVSLEYYMETLQAGRREPSYMLENAERCVEALDHERGSAVPTVEPAILSATGTLRTLQATATEVLTPQASAGRCRRAVAFAAAARAGPPVLPARPEATVADDAEPVDPELRADLRRGSARGDCADQGAFSGLGAKPAGNRLAGNVAPLIPYAEGQRPDGGCNSSQANLPGRSKIC